MATTKFSEIFDRAVFKLSEYDFLKMDENIKNSVFERYLASARVDFNPHCEGIDLSDIDDENKEFKAELSEEIQEILALGVAFYWLSAKTIRSDLLKNRIYNKDYSTFSPANLLKEIQTLRKEIKQEYNSKMKEYGYRYSNLDTLKA